MNWTLVWKLEMIGALIFLPFPTPEPQFIAYTWINSSHPGQAKLLQIMCQAI